MLEGLQRPEILLLIFGGAGVGAAVALLSWRSRGVPGAIAITVMGLGAVIYTVGYALELVAVGQDAKLLWAKVQYFGIVSTSPAWALVAIQFTGHGAWLRRRTRTIFYVIPLVFLILAWTNELHGLIWSGIEVGVRGGFSLLLLSHGVAFWLMLSYNYLLVVGGITLAVRAFLRAPTVFRLPATVLIISALLPWTTNVSFTLGWRLWGLNPTAFAFGLSGALLAWAMLRTNLLAPSSTIWRAAFEQMDEAVLVLDTTNRIITYNPAASELFGASLVIGEPAESLWPTSPTLLTSLEGSSHRSLEATIAVARIERTFDASIYSLNRDSNRPAGKLLLLRDVSRARQLEQQLVEAERLAATGTLAAGAAHEIGNPLMAIQGRAELLLRNPMLDEKTQASLETIAQESRRAGSIVKSLLSFARQDSPQKWRSSVNEMVETVLLLVGHQLGSHGVKVVQSLEEDLPAVIANPSQIQQVLLNLTLNAEQALADVQGDRTLSITTRSAEGTVLLEVGDNGPGMSRENVERVFEPFFTTKAPGEGAGLGLSVSYGIVRDHGGVISVVSEPGVGATFTVELPQASTDRGEQSSIKAPLPLRATQDTPDPGD